MSLRFLADHCVSNFIIASIQDNGHEVLRLKDYLPVESLDEDVIEKAQELDAILLSLNSDFASIINYPPRKYKGIICFRVRGRPEAVPHLIIRLKTYISDNQDMKHYKGKLFVIDVSRIRSRE